MDYNDLIANLVSKMKILKKIYLSYNNMKTFEHFQDIPKTVEIMDISKNPLGCNCNTWNSLSQLDSKIDPL